MPDNRIEHLENLLDELIRIYSSGNSSLKEQQQKFINTLQNADQEELQTLRSIMENVTNESESILKNVIDVMSRNSQQAATELQNIQDQIINLEQDYLTNKTAINDAESQSTKQILENKQREIQNQIQYLSKQKDIYEALSQNDTEKAALLQAEYEADKQRLERSKQLSELFSQWATGFLKRASDAVDAGFNSFISTYSNAVNRVAAAYNENAGKLSAMLGTSVDNISQLQQDVASQLNSSNLSQAISNVAVLNNAVSLASSGYTDQTTLQQNATDIAIGQKLAPTLDFSNTSVKNLINVFGPDFTQKFTAIAQATQDTAGSTAGLATTVSTLMTNLEPVYLNAELQSSALQGTADISATLSTAIENGIISEGMASTYRSMLVELMDPSKAYTSSNVAVRQAAMQYDFSGDVGEAFQALLNSTQSIFGNVSSGLNNESNRNRGLFASAMGFSNNTLEATYKPEAFTGVNYVNAEDLNATYSEQLSKLQSGDYTTASERVSNEAENNTIVQSIAVFAKEYPRTYQVMSTAILSAINNLPTRIAKAIQSYRSINNSNIGSSGGSSTNIEGYGNQSMGTAFKGLFKRSNTDVDGLPLFRNKGSGTRVGNFNTSLGGRTGGLAMMSYGAGITGLGNVIGSVASEDNLIVGLGMGGNSMSAMTSYAGIGSAVGTLIGGPLGTAIGGVIGALTGLGASLWANSEITKEQTEATERLNQSTKDVLGDGIQKLSSSEAKAIAASGGGIASLNSGDYAVDMDYYNSIPGAATGIGYVPYDDYLVRLHKGEAVVTANAASALRQQNPNFWNTPRNDDVVNALERQTKSIVGAVKGEDDKLPMSKSSPRTYTIKNASI